MTQSFPQQPSQQQKHSSVCLQSTIIETQGQKRKHQHHNKFNCVNYRNLLQYFKNKIVPRPCNRLHKYSPLLKSLICKILQIQCWILKTQKRKKNLNQQLKTSINLICDKKIYLIDKHQKHHPWFFLLRETDSLLLPAHHKSFYKKAYH